MRAARWNVAWAPAALAVWLICASSEGQGQGPALGRPPQQTPGRAPLGEPPPPPLPGLPSAPLLPPLPPPAPGDSGIALPGQPPALGSDALSEIVTAIALEGLPDKFEDRSDWGKTKKVFAGMEVDPRSDRFFPRISKHEIEVRHGLWRKHRVDLIRPERTFRISIDNVQPGGPGVTDFTVTAHIRARITANVEHWVRGVKGFNMEVVSQAHVVLRAQCSVACRAAPAPGALFPSLWIEPEVQSIRLRLADLHVEKLGELRGDLAEELGNGSRRFVEDLLQRREGDLTAKAQRELRERFSAPNGAEPAVSPGVN